MKVGYIFMSQEENQRAQFRKKRGRSAEKIYK